MVTTSDKKTLDGWIVERGMTVEALALKARVHRRTLDNWRKGRNRPRYDLLLPVAQVLGVPVEAIILMHEGAQPRNTESSFEQFRSDAKWYEQHKSELLEHYQGKRVAILNGTVVDWADELPALARRIRAKYGMTPVFMPLVTEKRRTVRMPSRATTRRKE